MNPARLHMPQDGQRVTVRRFCCYRFMVFKVIDTGPTVDPPLVLVRRLRTRCVYLFWGFPVAPIDPTVTLFFVRSLRT